ncbi:alkaline phosphatase family protein [Silvimonas iriomotensis]|nr:alkaline phosphatase family protein [Silvimonas iriomotensis]
MHPSTANIKHVIVLMLENRSFDHMLGDIPVDDVDGASGYNFNLIEPGGTPFFQTPAAVFQSPHKFDPKHEFENVQLQLGYASLDMSGFAIDALATAKLIKGYGTLFPDEQRAIVQTVMNYFPKGSLPGIHSLATQFAVSDRWFASVPGPTWPNRFFAMMGSCHGKLHMPDGPASVITAVRSIAAQLGKNSIFSVLGGGMHKIYSDYTVPLSVLLKGSNRHEPLSQFKADVKAHTLPAFSWIEPDYSSDLNKANSQHPPEDIRRGDGLVVEIYNTLRAEDEVWKKSLLVLLHDEHGGFYDHVEPPETIAPDDEPADAKFDFKRLGVRVPAVLVSPWIKQGVVRSDKDKPVYDHTSLLAFICDLFGLSRSKPALGKRVATADHFGHADVWSDNLRDVPADQLVAEAPEVSGQEAASGALDTALQGLVAGLHAHARIELNRTTRGALMLADGGDAIARQHIADAWNSGLAGRTSDDIGQMVKDIKSTFGAG